MIIYDKTLWGIPLLTRMYGSALPRSVAPAVISGLFTLALLLLGDRVQHLWNHPFAYNPFALIVSFVLTFRSNYAYQRHWEAYTQMQNMTARWLDAAVQIIMFDKHPQPPSGSSSLQQQHQGSRAASLTAASAHHQFVAEVIHLISLLHGTCCAAVRRDPDLANLVRHCRSSEAPPQDPALISRESVPGSPRSGAAVAAGPALFGSGPLQGGSPRSPSSGGGSSFGRWATGAAKPFSANVDIIGAANWRDIFMLRGSPGTLRKYNKAQPLGVIGGVSQQERAALGCEGNFGENKGDDGGYGMGKKGGITAQPWACSTVEDAGTAVAQPNSFWGMLRHRQSFQPQPQASQQQQGMFQLQRVRSQSYSEGLADAGRTTAGSQPGGGFRHTCSRYFDVGRMNSVLPSFGHLFNSSKTAPGSSSHSHHSKVSRLQRIMPHRFRTSLNHTCCHAHLPYMDRPFLLLSWVYELLLERQAAGGLQLPAPILARVYTCLSDGIHAYEQCRKLADTPFPFPWAQFVLVMLVLFTFTLPLLVLAYVGNTALAVVLTVVTVSTYWTVNEVARDVEDAFIMEPNNMPVANSQFHFNELLLTLSVAQRPASGVVPVVLPMPPAQSHAAAPVGPSLMAMAPHMIRTGTLPALSGGWGAAAAARPAPPEAAAAAAQPDMAAAAAAAAAESVGHSSGVSSPASMPQAAEEDVSAAVGCHACTAGAASAAAAACQRPSSDGRNSDSSNDATPTATTVQHPLQLHLPQPVSQTLRRTSQSSSIGGAAPLGTVLDPDAAPDVGDVATVIPVVPDAGIAAPHSPFQAVVRVSANDCCATRDDGICNTSSKYAMAPEGEGRSSNADEMV